MPLIRDLLDTVHLGIKLLLFLSLLLGHIAVLCMSMRSVVTDRVVWSVCRSVTLVSATGWYTAETAPVVGADY